MEELKHYFHQIAPDLPVERAAKELWHSVDTFGEEGSREKELGIEGAILGKAARPLNSERAGP